MKALVVEDVLELTLFDIIRFQINHYCFINKIRLSPAQLETLAFLGMYGEINISDFCEQLVSEEELFTNTQTVRNFIIKSVKDGYVIRTGLGNKMIKLSESLKVLTEGNIVINLKLYHVKRNETSNTD